MTHALLFPYAEIVITSSTIPQATKMVKKKMEDELCKKLSSVLKYYYDNGDIILSTVFVCQFNQTLRLIRQAACTV